MLGRTQFLVLGVITTGAAGGILALRRRADAADMEPRDYLARAFRHFVTYRFDPLVTRLGLVGGRVSHWAMLEHVGRVSGTIRRTPVLPGLSPATAYIPLPYGTDVHWAQNVLAAGHCRMQLHERVYELDEPRIVAADENETLPGWARDLRRRRGTKYLALHRLSDVVGTFAPLADATGTPEEDWLIAPLEEAPGVPLEPMPAGAAT